MNVMYDDCEHLRHVDAIWHGRERHDFYCDYHMIWCPDCKGCKFNKNEKDDEE